MITMRRSRFIFERAALIAFATLVFDAGAGGQETEQPKPPPPKVGKEDPPIPTKNYAQTYEQSFQVTGVRPEGWNFTAKISEQLVRFEPAGLRITLPPGEPLGAAIVSQFRVKGDFEITLRFEVLKAPDPADAGKGGTRFSLVIALDTPKAEAAALSRSVRGLVTWARRRHEAVPLSHGFPMSEMTGRLRMVRNGEELFFLAAGGADEPFRFLTKYRLGAEDLKHVGLTSATGSDKAMLDVRVSDFRVRADELPGVAVADGPAQQAAPSGPIAQGQASDRAALVVALAVALTITLALAVALALRKRRGASGPTPP